MESWRSSMAWCLESRRLHTWTAVWTPGWGTCALESDAHKTACTVGARYQTRRLGKMEKKKTWWMRGELAVMRFYFQRIHSSLIWFGLWNWLALTDREGVNELQGSRVSMKEREPRARLWTTHGRGFFSSGETGETSEWRGLWIWRMVYACLDKHETWHARKNPSRLGLALSGSPSI